MSYVYGALAGVAAYEVWLRFVRRFLIRQFDPSRTKTIRRELLDKMGYDTLVKFREAADEEIARRQGSR